MSDLLMVSLLAIVLLCGTDSFASDKKFPGASRVDYAGYKGCVKLENGTASVIIGQHAGGRVLEYSLNGKDVIKLDPKQAGYTYKPGSAEIDLYGGRFDIGPEQVIPGHPVLWLGEWDAEITGPREVRLTSAEDKATGVRLIRDFRLDEKTSRLVITQTMKNISGDKKEWCYWSRTLAQGGGICMVPLNPESRFPDGYIIYGPGPVMNFEPGNQPNVRVREGFLEITGAPEQPKFGLDSYAGWFSYLMKNDVLFVKRFPVHPDRVYNEMAAITVSIYYHQDVLCELEPIGPKEMLKPGESASFTEEWWLLPYEYPAAGEAVDLNAMADFVRKRAK